LPVAQLENFVTERNFSLLSISAAHVAAYDRIPLLSDHRDPFDRLLVATALAEDMSIVSADSHFPQYAPLVSVIVG
jgi:PIN domain nuclease of toxin-antitoxin system